MRTSVILCAVAAFAAMAMAIPISEEYTTIIPNVAPLCRLNVLEADAEDWSAKAIRCSEKLTADDCKAKRYCWWDDSHATNFYINVSNSIASAAGILTPLPGVTTFYGIQGAFMAYTTIVETEHYVIVINAGQSTAGTAAINNYIHTVIGKPIGWVIMTHAHFDEFSDGVSLFQLNYPAPMTVICPAGYPADLAMQSYIAPLSPTSLAGVNLDRNLGLSLPRDTDWRIAAKLAFGGNPLAPPPLSPPLPGVTFSYVVADGQQMVLDGLTVVFYVTPADLPGEISVFFPTLKLLYASDVITSTVPPTSTYRADPVRDHAKWMASVAKIKDLDYDYLFSSTIPPQFSVSRAAAHEIAQIYYNALVDVNNYVLAGLIAGNSVENIETSYALPQFVLDAQQKYWPLFTETYHPLTLTVRGVIQTYVGIANNRYSQLRRMPVAERQFRLIELAGDAERALKRASDMVQYGTREDLVFALEIGEALVQTGLDTDNGKLLMYQCCFQLSHMELSLTGRNYYASCAHTYKPEF